MGEKRKGIYEMRKEIVKLRKNTVSAGLSITHQKLIQSTKWI